MLSTKDQSQTAPAPPQRVALWDHARFFLLFLIVTGHMVEALRDSSNAAYLIYLYVYLFHVAALLAISGFFSKPNLNHRTIRSVIQLVFVWLAWEVIFTVVYHYTEDADISVENIVVPSWGLWFLLTLATLRVLLPIMARLKHPLLISIALALSAGLVPEIGTAFSASRSLYFLPFFVAGWLAKDRGWTERKWFAHPTWALRAAAALVFALVAFVLLAFPNLEERWRLDRWTLGRASYQDLLEPGEPGMLDALRPYGVGEDVMLTDATGLLIRVAVMATAAVMTVALLLLVPRRSFGWSRMLQRTLYVYLLHILIIVALRPLEIVEDIGELGVHGVLALVAISAVLTIVLSTDLVAKVTRPVVEPNVDWLLRPDDSAPAQATSPEANARNEQRQREQHDVVDDVDDTTPGRGPGSDGDQRRDHDHRQPT